MGVADRGELTGNGGGRIGVNVNQLIRPAGVAYNVFKRINAAAEPLSGGYANSHLTVWLHRRLLALWWGQGNLSKYPRRQLAKADPVSPDGERPLPGSSSKSKSTTGQFLLASSRIWAYHSHPRMSDLRCRRQIKTTMAITPISTASRLLFWLLLVLPCAAGAEKFHVERLNGGEPIISAEHFRQLGAPENEGNNINGPSVIRIPDWIPKEKRAAPAAQYYLYFAHHNGEYIRLAWAETIAGPWQLYGTGEDVAPGQRGVLDMGDDRLITLAGAYSITSHIASPDVHVDDENKQIVLYFHGGTSHNGLHVQDQKSYVATSPWGLDFSSGINPVPLGGSYLRVLDVNGILQGLYSSYHVRARSNTSPWSVAQGEELVGDALWELHDARFLEFQDIQKADGRIAHNGTPRVRHVALYRTGDRLHVFYTMKGDAPERILVTSVDVNSVNWFDVAPETSPAEVLRAEREWEGAGIAPERSRKGPEFRLVNALRDPYVLNDRGSLYLFYAGGGERAIGVARLTLDPG